MPAKGLARHRQLAPNAAIRVSPLCLGTMTFGTVHSEKYGKCDKETSFKIMDTFYSAGGNFFDTANTYRDGESEQWLGEWMAGHGNRDELVIATKYTSPYKPLPEGAINSNLSGNSLKSMRLSIEASLQRLQTTYIDLFYLHSWDYTTSIPELMRGLNDLVTSGKVLYLGISDTPAWIVSKANQYALDHGLRPFAVYQGMWNAGMRDLEREIIPMALYEGMAICPYAVLNQGRFQTREGYKQREESGNKDGRNFIPLSEHDKRIAGALEDLAAARGNGNELLNVALAYVLQKAPYVFPIIGGRKVEHLSSNLKALDIFLSDDEMHKIEQAYPFDHGFPTNFLNTALFNPDQESYMVTGPEHVQMQALDNMDWVKGPQAIRPTQN